mgnify:CR=1 FL=1
MLSVPETGPSRQFGVLLSARWLRTLALSWPPPLLERGVCQRSSYTKFWSGIFPIFGQERGHSSSRAHSGRREHNGWPVVHSSCPRHRNLGGCRCILSPGWSDSPCRSEPARSGATRTAPAPPKQYFCIPSGLKCARSRMGSESVERTSKILVVAAVALVHPTAY